MNFGMGGGAFKVRKPLSHHDVLYGVLVVYEREDPHLSLTLNLGHSSD
jgi:hypothetical protein